MGRVGKTKQQRGIKEIGQKLYMSPGWLAPLRDRVCERTHDSEASFLLWRGGGMAAYRKEKENWQDSV